MKTTVTGLARLTRTIGVVAACVALAGCAATSADSGTAQTTGGVFSTPDPSIETTLTVWSYLDTGTYKEVFANFESEFKERYPNVTFEYLYTTFGELRNKVLTAAASGDGPDVLIYDPADTPVLAQAGALADLTDSWAEFEDRDQWPEALTWKANDAIYTAQSYVNTTALYYNIEILEAAGVSEPPTTLEEFDAALEKVNAAGFDGFAVGASPTTGSETVAICWILGQGGNYDNLDDPGVLNVLQTFERWGAEGYIPRDAATWDTSAANQAWLGGNTAFTQSGNWLLEVNKQDAGFEWGVAPLPGAKVAPGGEGQAVGAFGDDKDLAWEFLKSTYWTEEGQLMILDTAGSIPARADAAAAPAVKEDPYLPAWTTEIADSGSRPPVKDGDIQQATSVLGEVWSAIISGQTSAEDGLQRVEQSVEGLF